MRTISGLTGGKARPYRHRYAKNVRWRSGELTSGKPCVTLTIDGKQAVLNCDEVIDLLAGMTEFLAAAKEPVDG